MGDDTQKMNKTENERTFVFDSSEVATDPTLRGRDYSRGDSSSDNIENISGDGTVVLKERDSESAPTMNGDAPRPPQGPKVGDRLVNGRYEILSELGRGGMGVVYRCLDTVAGVEVALKALPPELSHNRAEMEEVRDNFQLVSRLVHQNIAVSKTLERDDSTGDYYLVMECVAGVDLRAWMRRQRKDKGGITLEAALPILRQVAEALDYAHSEKIMHRDIKPGNVMLAPNGLVKVLDFGLAAQIHSSMSLVSKAYNGTSGTRAYMSPEQWCGKPQGAAADQYAMAVMAYEMLAGHLPFDAADTDVLKRAVLEEKPEPIDGLPKHANDALLRALSKEASKRFPSCCVFVEALDGVGFRISSTGSKYTKRIVAGVAVLAMLAAVSFFTMRGRDSDKTDSTSGSELQQPNPQTVTMPVETPQNLPSAIDPEKAQDSKTVAVPKTPQNPPSAIETQNQPEPSVQPPASISNVDIQQMQDVYSWQAALKYSIPAIKSSQYDRGQTFSTHLDNLMRTYNAAEEAMKDTANVKRFAEVHPLYKTAKEEVEWFRANAPLREQAKKLLQEVDILQKKAKDEGGDRLAIVDYGPAEKLLTDAHKTFEDGKFNETLEALKKAPSGFERSYANARTANIGILLDSARLALQAARWEDAANKANSVLAKDANNADAMKIKSDAEAGAKRDRIAELIASARKAYNDKDWEKAKNDADAVLALDANNTDAMKIKSDAEVGAKRDRIAELIASARKAYNDKDWEMAKNDADAVFVLDANNADAAKIKSDAEAGAKKEKIDKLLATARREMDGKAWDKALISIGAVLALEPGNADAIRMKKRVEDNQRTTLVVYAQANGRNVDTDIKFSPAFKKQLERGVELEAEKSYHLSCTYKDGDESWEGTMDITADWKGERTQTIVMRKIAFYGMRKIAFNGIMLDLNGIPLKMIKVKAGRFQMGSPEKELGRDREETQHWVTLTRDYWLGETEVTQGQWKAVMGTNPSHFKKGDNYPVECVSWEDVMDFCRKLNEKYSSKLPSGYKFSLPTEAQWEYACRAGTTTALNNGNNLKSEYDICRNLDEVGWYYENSDSSTHPVAQKKPNALDFYDMHGNVWEWCSDWKGGYNMGATDPKGPSAGSHRVCRGGSWYCDARFCRAAYRYGYFPSYRYRNLGFRLALVPVQ